MEKMLTIALLEDHPDIREFLTIALKMDGHQVFPFAEAAPLLLVDPHHWDLLIADHLLPGRISGARTIIELRKVRPDLPAIVISSAGYMELNLIATSLQNVPILRKPFKIAQIMRTIAEVTSRLPSGVHQSEASIPTSPTPSMPRPGGQHSP